MDQHSIQGEWDEEYNKIRMSNPKITLILTINLFLTRTHAVNLTRQYTSDNVGTLCHPKTLGTVQ